MSHALSSFVGSASRLLTWVCLRYAVAMPSVWPCRRACKQRQFSDFRFDSPVDFNVFWLCFCDAGRCFQVCRPLVPHWTVRSASASRSQVTCLSRGFSFLGLYWRSFANRLIFGNRLRSGFRQSKMTAYAAAWMTIGNHVNNELTGSSWLVDVDRWCHTPSVGSGQKGTEHVSKSRSSKFHASFYNRRHWPR